MRRFLFVVIGALLVAAGASLAADHAFVGVKKCSMCHKGERHGNIFETWQGTAHAKAFTDLASDSAKAVYARLGKTGDPQKDPACLKCHVTGYGMDAALTAAVVPENGVTCESCHGAGGDYWKMSVMKDKDQAMAAGLDAEPKDACVKCHNADSPTFTSFSFEEYWPKIEHKLPAAK